jgi:hypothetical protein
MIPSVTAVSRAALLSGRPDSGGRGGESIEITEQEGFTDFWEQHHGGHGAALFHRSQIAGPPGHRLDPRLVTAIASDAVVGVVLDTIEERLDHSRQAARADWPVESVTYLPELLNTARGQGRPVMLVSGCGHVPDRTGPEADPVEAEGVESARWRTGEAGAGEVALAGPRVVENGGRLTAAWSEDIHYTPRKAGYQGGAALAEMAVPVLVLVPSAELAPAGWAVLPREAVEPRWWEPKVSETSSVTPVPAPAPAPVRKQRKPAKSAVPKPAPHDGAALFADDAVEVPPVMSASAEAAPVTLGRQVVATKIYERQGVFVRKAPDRKAVAAVIDALHEAGGKLSLAAVVAAVTASGGRAPQRPEGLITVLSRLLNVEGYDVISLIDSRTRVQLNMAQLREQFELPGDTA